MGEKKKKYVSVKLEENVYQYVRTVAAWRGLNVADYLSDLVRVPARRDFVKLKEQATGTEDATG